MSLNSRVLLSPWGRSLVLGPSCLRSLNTAYVHNALHYQALALLTEMFQFVQYWPQLLRTVQLDTGQKHTTTSDYNTSKRAIAYFLPSDVAFTKAKYIYLPLFREHTWPFSCIWVKVTQNFEIHIFMFIVKYETECHFIFCRYVFYSGSSILMLVKLGADNYYTTEEASNVRI